MHSWDGLLTPLDREVLAVSGYGASLGLGMRPALAIVDVTYGFTGDRPEPILDSIVRWRRSSGDRAWNALPFIQRLRESFRAANLPVFYSRGMEAHEDGASPGLWRNTRKHEVAPSGVPRDHDIVKEIAPGPGEVVIPKTGPSMFFSTPFMSHLLYRGVDSLVVCGTTTSGCVRATVVDGFSYGIPIAVAEEGCFDRFESSHASSLFDMNAKYADVMHTDEIIATIDALAAQGGAI